MLSGNRFYFLKLKNYDTNIVADCDCLEDIHLGDYQGVKLQSLFSTRPSPNVKKLFLREAIQTHPINFITVFGNKPKDLAVTASSDNSNITVSSSVDLDSDGNFIIEILSANVPEGVTERAKISFQGLSSNNEYKITIDPLDIVIINEIKSKVVIKEIRVK